MTTAPDPLENPPGEECGVFGVWAPGEDVAKLSYYGLHALQHRGQEAAGIAVSDGSRILVVKDLGLVSKVFDESSLSTLTGHIAIGHCRYSTTGAPVWENAQPVFRTVASGGCLALGHNGNLVNTLELLERSTASPSLLRVDPRNYNRDTVGTDSDLICGLLARMADDPQLELEDLGGRTAIERAALKLLPTLRGAFCLTFLDENTLYAARDPWGVRPLCLGRLERGWVLASETSALDIVGASFVRDIEPGELLAIDMDGVRSTRFANPQPKGCVFEYVYLARPDSVIAGRSVHAARVEIGRRLAEEHPVDADLVIPRAPSPGTPRRHWLRPGLRHPLRARAHQERVCRAHLHPTVANHPPARHSAQTQSDARGHPGQTPRGGGRLDRAGQHATGFGADAARGGGCRSACADRVAAGALAVLLRHRLPEHDRAHRQRGGRARGDARRRPSFDPRRLARPHFARRARGRDRATAHPALHGLLQRGLPDPAARRGRIGQVGVGRPGRLAPRRWAARMFGRRSQMVTASARR